jgi:hypothetical protein
MAKTAFQAIASKAEKFVWNPAENQDYRGVLDPPDPGSGSSFDKQSNKTFTMNVPGNNNAPGKPFELKVNDGSSTTWVGGGSARAPSIDIQSGTFIHSGNCISGADLVLGLDYILFLRASADAICSLTGLNGVESPGGLNVSLGDRRRLKCNTPASGLRLPRPPISPLMTMRRCKRYPRFSKYGISSSASIPRVVTAL